MAARGTVAKSNVNKMLINAFGKDYIGEYGGKTYVWANDGGERVQIAIALTCPKTFIETADVSPVVEEKKDFDWDFEDTVNENAKKVSHKATEITQEEQDNIRNLMKSIGLI